MFVYLRTRNPNMKKHIYSTRVKAPDNNSIPDVRASSMSNWTNDDVPSNPTGRGAADGKSKRNKLLSCKSYIQVATFNTRTLRTEEKRMELNNNYNKYEFKRCS